MEKKAFRRKTDNLYWKLYKRLTEDAAEALGAEDPHMFTRKTLVDLRNYGYPSGISTDKPYIVKWMAQLNGFLKRYTFTDDLHSPLVLARESEKKFDDLQMTLPSGKPGNLGLSRVLSSARKWIRETLGDYDEEEHQALCSFGSRAAKHVSRRNGYLDRRLGLVSSSAQHRAWFQRVLSKDKLLERVMHKSIYAIVSCLDLICVPKSWKSYRTIMPDTVLGGFSSKGLGRVLVRRLKMNRRIDLRHWQIKHQKLARRNSVTRRLATADLSSASDSFTLWLVRCLLPSRWWRVLKQGRVAHYMPTDGSQKYLTSFMAMGIGYTFPLQTILFYGMLKGIQIETGIQGHISVFGDDLVYPTKMHKYVVKYFGLCGFKMNLDKTFVHTHFRESCGGDFYRGKDVRPFSPQGEGAVLGRTAYLAELHKLHNGLLRKWDEVEIPRTIEYIRSEIEQTIGGYLFIGDHMPDYAGLKGMETWRANSLVVEQESELVVLAPTRDNRIVAVATAKRLCEDQLPYFWQTLSGLPIEEQHYSSEPRSEEDKWGWNARLTFLREFDLSKKSSVERWLGYRFTEKPALTFLKRKRMKIRGKTVVRKQGAYVVEPDARPRYTLTVSKQL